MGLTIWRLLRQLTLWNALRDAGSFFLWLAAGNRWGDGQWYWRWCRNRSLQQYPSFTVKCDVRPGEISRHATDGTAATTGRPLISTCGRKPKWRRHRVVATLHLPDSSLRWALIRTKPNELGLQSADCATGHLSAPLVLEK